VARGARVEVHLHHRGRHDRSDRPDRYRATGRLEGNFPGGTVELKWDFTIARGLITRLEIAP
jgi:hypothetical protein